MVDCGYCTKELATLVSVVASLAALVCIHLAAQWRHPVRRIWILSDVSMPWQPAWPACHCCPPCCCCCCRPCISLTVSLAHRPIWLVIPTADIVSCTHCSSGEYNITSRFCRSCSALQTFACCLRSTALCCGASRQSRSPDGDYASLRHCVSDF